MKLPFLLVTVSWALLALGVSADTADPKAPKPVLVRLISTSADGFGGFGGFGGGGGRSERNPWVVVAPIEAGKPTRLPVPEAYAKRLEPFANNRGQLVFVTVAPVAINGATVEAVTEINRYDGDAAIANPGIYQFDGLTTAADGKSATVKLSKAGPARTIPVVTRPAAAGAPPQPDPQVIARLQKLSAGALVEATLTAGKAPTLIDAYPYTQPTTGEFVKLLPLKSGQNKSAIVLQVGKELKAYALPTPATGPGVSTQANASITAVNTLSKRLKPGNGVSLWLHDAPDASAAPTATPATSPSVDPVLSGVIREMRYAGRVELTGEKSVDVHSTYVRVEIDEGRAGFGRGGFGGGGGGIEVDYNLQDANADRAALFRGIERILQSVDDALKLNIVFEQADALNSAIKPTRSRRPTGQEQAAWITAQKAYLTATTEDARRKVEQDMIVAAQELSLRIRQDYVTAETAARSILKPGQADGLIKLGEEDRGGGGFPGFGRGFGRDRDRNDQPGQNNGGQNNGAPTPPGQNNGQNQQNGQN